MSSSEAMKAGSFCWVQGKHEKRPAVVVSVRILGEEEPPSGPRVQYYVHFDGSDKRLDEWVDQQAVELRELEVPGSSGGAEPASTFQGTSEMVPPSAVSLGKRKRIETGSEVTKDSSPVPSQDSHSRNASPALTNTSQRASGPLAKSLLRNIEKVYFGAYVIKTWYYSPYPLEDDDTDATPDGGKAAAPTSGRASGTGRGRWPEGSKASREREQARKERELQLLAASSVPSGSEPSDVRTSATAAPSEMPPLNMTPKPGGALSNEGPLLAKKANGHTAVLNPAVTKAVRSANSPAPRSAQPRDLWVCEGCFKYMRTYGGWNAHKKECKYTHPPGRKVYQRGAHIIWEVDGAEAKLYCQNLSLFGKLFIDHKTIYFDVEPFLFYVLTDASTQFDHALGYFSKEKVSYDHYNLACIITFPPYQRKGFGTLMIEFSYFLSSLGEWPGTPERPLSDLGLKGYLSYWSSVVLRTLALALDVSESILPIPAPSGAADQRSSAVAAAAGSSPVSGEKRAAAARRVRIVLAGLPHKDGRENGTRIIPTGERDATHQRLKRTSRGWAGEVVRGSTSADGSGDGHAGRSPSPWSGTEIDAQGAPRMTLETTLERLASACRMRVEDTAFALNECELLGWTTGDGGMGNGHTEDAGRDQQEVGEGDAEGTEEDGHSTTPVLLLKQAVEEAIVKRKVKRKVLDEAYVLM